MALLKFKFILETFKKKQENEVFLKNEMKNQVNFCKNVKT